MKLEDYLDYELSIAVGDGEEKYTVIDAFIAQERNILVIAPTKQIEQDVDCPEVMFIEVEFTDEADANKLTVISDENDYNALFEIYEAICNAEDDCCDDDSCDDDEETLLIEVQDEDGNEVTLSLYDTFFYDDRKFNLFIPADEESEDETRIVIFEVVDYEADVDDPEVDKQWEMVDRDYMEELCEFLEEAYSEEDDSEEEEDDEE